MTCGLLERRGNLAIGSFKAGRILPPWIRDEQRAVRAERTDKVDAVPGEAVVRGDPTVVVVVEDEHNVGMPHQVCRNDP
jgi:hypothetical protein